MSILKKIQEGIAVLAALTMVSLPVAAAAQEAQLPQQRKFGVEVSTPLQAVQTVEPAMGLQLLPSEWNRLRTDDCVIGPEKTAARIYEWAAEEGVSPCTKEFYSKVDNFLGKESMAFFRVTRTGHGYQHCDLVKATNLGNNRGACVTFPFNPAYNEAGKVGRFADVNYAEGGDVVVARAATSLGGALISGPLTAFTAAKSQKMCDNCGDTFNIQGAQAVSASRSDASALTSLQNVISAGTGTCSTCGPRPTTPPSGGGSGHTVDGPGSAPYNPGG